jgi:hypothetical protein
MKRVLLFLSLILLVLLLPTVALAQDSIRHTHFEVKKGEVINHDYFAAGESVTISGVVNGDVYAAGANVTIDGKINGDLLAGAGMITLLGEVTDDVRIAGGNILINGTTGKNVTLAGGTATITSEAIIKGSLLAFTGNLDLRAAVGRDANLYAGRAVIGSQIGGNLQGEFDELVLTSEAGILGNLNYKSSEKAEITEGAIILGETNYQSLTRERAPQLKPDLLARPAVPRGVGLWLSFSSLILSFLLGLGFLYVFPKRGEAIVKVLTSRPWQSLGVGFLTLILIPIGMLFLMITIIGIPLALMLVPLLVFLLYFSKIFAAFCTGQWVLNRWEVKKGLNWALLIGLIVYYLLRQLPVISPMVIFAFTTLGLGAFILDQKALRGKK